MSLGTLTRGFGSGTLVVLAMLATLPAVRAPIGGSGSGPGSGFGFGPNGPDCLPDTVFEPTGVFQTVWCEIAFTGGSENLEVFHETNVTGENVQTRLTNTSWDSILPQIAQSSDTRWLYTVFVELDEQNGTRFYYTGSVTNGTSWSEVQPGPVLPVYAFGFSYDAVVVNDKLELVWDGKVEETISPDLDGDRIPDYNDPYPTQYFAEGYPLYPGAVAVQYDLGVSVAVSYERGPSAVPTISQTVPPSELFVSTGLCLAIASANPDVAEAMIKVDYNASLLESFVDEPFLRIYEFANGSWQMLVESGVRLDEKYVWGITDQWGIITIADASGIDSDMDLRPDLWEERLVPGLSLTLDASNSTSPAAFADETDIIHLAYLEDTGSAFRVVYRRGPNFGHAWDLTRILHISGLRPEQLQIAGSEERLAAIWQETDATSGAAEVYLAAGQSGGYDWDGTFPVSPPDFESRNPSVAVSGDRIYFAADMTNTGPNQTWASGLYLMWFNDTHNGSHLFQDGASAVRGFGTLLVEDTVIYAVLANTTSDTLGFTRSADSGGNWTQLQTIGSYFGTDSPRDMTLRRTGEALSLVFSDARLGVDEVFYTASMNNGTSWSTLSTLSLPSGPSRAASLAFDGQSVLLGWREGSDAVSVLSTRRVNPGVEQVLTSYATSELTDAGQTTGNYTWTLASDDEYEVVQEVEHANLLELAYKEETVLGQVASGDFSVTWSSDDLREVIAGAPADNWTVDHLWTFWIPEGVEHALTVEAKSPTGASFAFYLRTDYETIPVLDVNTSFEQTYTVPLPPDAEGRVLLEVVKAVGSNESALEIDLLRVDTSGTPFSTLSHTWVIDVPAGSSHTLAVEAFRSPDSDGDDFVVSYSLDGHNYVDVLRINATTDSDTPIMATLPPLLGGRVHVKIADTDRRPGASSTYGQVFVDYLAITTHKETLSLYGEPGTLSVDSVGVDHPVLVASRTGQWMALWDGARANRRQILQVFAEDTIVEASRDTLSVLSRLANQIEDVPPGDFVFDAAVGRSDLEALVRCGRWMLNSEDRNAAALLLAGSLMRSADQQLDASDSWSSVERTIKEGKDGAEPTVAPDDRTPYPPSGLVATASCTQMLVDWAPSPPRRIEFQIGEVTLRKTIRPHYYNVYRDDGLGGGFGVVGSTPRDPGGKPPTDFVDSTALRGVDYAYYATGVYVETKVSYPCPNCEPIYTETQWESSPSNMDNAMLLALPTVVAFSPAGSGVSVKTSISVKFSQAMDQPSVESGITVTPTSTYAASWADGGTSILLVPTADLAFSTSYTVRISGDIAKDLCGQELDGNFDGQDWDYGLDDFTFGFTTQIAPPDVSPPTVKYVYPEDQKDDVSTDVVIRFGFSERMNVISVENSLWFGPDGSLQWGRHLGAWTILGDTDFEFRPDDELEAARSYTFQLRGDVAKDQAGNTLDGDEDGVAEGISDSKTWSFSTSFPLDAEGAEEAILLQWSANRPGATFDIQAGPTGTSSFSTVVAGLPGSTATYTLAREHGIDFNTPLDLRVQLRDGTFQAYSSVEAGVTAYSTRYELDVGLTGDTTRASPGLSILQPGWTGPASSGTVTWRSFDGINEQQFLLTLRDPDSDHDPETHTRFIVTFRYRAPEDRFVHQRDASGHMRQLGALPGGNIWRTGSVFVETTWGVGRISDWDPATDDLDLLFEVSPMDVDTIEAAPVAWTMNDMSDDPESYDQHSPGIRRHGVSDGIDILAPRLSADYSVSVQLYVQSAGDLEIRQRTGPPPSGYYLLRQFSLNADPSRVQTVSFFTDHSHYGDWNPSNQVYDLYVQFFWTGGLSPLFGAVVAVPSSHETDVGDPTDGIASLREYGVSLVSSDWGTPEESGGETYREGLVTSPRLVLHSLSAAFHPSAFDNPYTTDPSFPHHKVRVVFVNYVTVPDLFIAMADGERDPLPKWQKGGIMEWEYFIETNRVVIGDNPTQPFGVDIDLNFDGAPAVDRIEVFTDTDGDLAYGDDELVLTTDGTDIDTDGDTLWDGWEWANGADLNPTSPDTDGDHVPDQVEDFEDNGPGNAAGDGLTNADEFAFRDAGTDPHVPDILVEVDWMPNVLDIFWAGGFPIPLERRFFLTWAEKNLIVSRFAAHGIHLEFDDGRAGFDHGGGNQIAFQREFDHDDDRIHYYDNVGGDGFTPGRHGRWHYGIMAWLDADDPSSGGISWGGTDLSWLIVFRGVADDFTSGARNAFLHELGHRLFGEINPEADRFPGGCGRPADTTHDRFDAFVMWRCMRNEWTTDYHANRWQELLLEGVGSRLP